MDRRARSFKSRGYLTQAAEARRQAWLRRQSDARRDLSHHLRLLQKQGTEEEEEEAEDAVGVGMDEAVDDAEASSRGADAMAIEGEGRSSADRKARSFQAWRRSPVAVPEWMNEVPPDLPSHWYVAVRPAGKRVLVTAASGTTTLRTRYGRRLCIDGPATSVQSALPGGFVTKGGKSGLTVLDGILSEHDPGSVYVLDILVWNDNNLLDCSFEFRYFWLTTRLAEIQAEGRGERPLRFGAVECRDADPEAIQAAYESATLLRDDGRHHGADGLLFFHRAAHYHLGTTPLILQWKDPSTSNYAVETWQRQPPSALAETVAPMDASEPPPLSVSLSLSPDSVLLTSDEPAVRMSTPVVDPVVAAAAAGRGGANLLRFVVGNTQELCHLSEDEVRVPFVLGLRTPGSRKKKHPEGCLHRPH